MKSLLISVVFIINVFQLGAQNLNYKVFDIERGFELKKTLLMDSNLIVISGKSDWLEFSKKIQLDIFFQKESLPKSKVFDLLFEGIDYYFYDSYISNQQLYLICFNRINNSIIFKTIVYNNEALTLLKDLNPFFIDESSFISGETYPILSASENVFALIHISPANYEGTKVLTATSYKLSTESTIKTYKYLLGDNINLYSLQHVFIRENGDLIFLAKKYLTLGAETKDGKANYVYSIDLMNAVSKDFSVQIHSERIIKNPIVKLLTDDRLLFNCYSTDTMFNNALEFIYGEISINEKRITSETIIVVPNELNPINELDNNIYILDSTFTFTYEKQLLTLKNSAKQSNSFEISCSDIYTILSDTFFNPISQNNTRKSGSYNIKPANHVNIIPSTKSLIYIQTPTRDSYKSYLIRKDILLNKTQQFELYKQYWQPENPFKIIIDRNLFFIIQPQFNKYLIITE